MNAWVDPESTDDGELLQFLGNTAQSLQESENGLLKPCQPALVSRPTAIRRIDTAR